MYKIGDKVYHIRDFYVESVVIIAADTINVQLADIAEEVVRYMVVSDEVNLQTVSLDNGLIQWIKSGNCRDWVDEADLYATKESAQEACDKFIKAKREAEELAKKTEQLMKEQQAEVQFRRFRAESKEWHSVEDLEKAIFEAFKNGMLDYSKSFIQI